MEIAMPGVRAVPMTSVRPLPPVSFDEIYEKYQAPVYRLACALSDNARDAEDLFQENRLRAVRAGRDAGGGGDTRTWLFTIAANLHRDALRKKRIRRIFFLERARSMADGESDADPGWESGRFSSRDFSGRTDLGLCLGRAVSRLPARQREVFVLKDIEGYKHEEIGRMLGLPCPTVRTLLHRAVKSLQRELAAFRPGAGGAPAGEEDEP